MTTVTAVVSEPGQVDVAVTGSFTVAAPGQHVFPAKGNRGCLDVSKLKPVGSQKFGTAGDVITGLDIVGNVVTTADVTLQGCRVTGSTSPLVRNMGGKLRLVDTTIVGGNILGQDDVGYGDFTVLRCDISRSQDGMKASANCDIEDSFIHDLYRLAGQSHSDGIQIGSGSNIRIVGNTIENPFVSVSCILIKADQGDISNVLVQGNLLAGGGWCVYGGATAANHKASAVKILGNRFSTKYYPKCGALGPIAALLHDAGSAYSGNVWHETGKAA
jgi:hypothetical protein